MTLEEFIASNPTRDKIAFQICGVANQNVLEIDETFVWKPLSELEDLLRMISMTMSKVHLTCMGQRH